MRRIKPAKKVPEPDTYLSVWSPLIHKTLYTEQLITQLPWAVKPREWSKVEVLYYPDVKLLVNAESCVSKSFLPRSLGKPEYPGNLINKNQVGNTTFDFKSACPQIFFDRFRTIVKYRESEESWREAYRVIRRQGTHEEHAR